MARELAIWLREWEEQNEGMNFRLMRLIFRRNNTIKLLKDTKDVSHFNTKILLITVDSSFKFKNCCFFSKRIVLWTDHMFLIRLLDQSIPFIKILPAILSKNMLSTFSLQKFFLYSFQKRYSYFLFLLSKVNLEQT